MSQNVNPIIVEQQFNRSQEATWHAITKVSEMTQWFFENIPDFKAEVGFQTRFNVSTPDRDFLHVWKIIDVIPLKKIVYDWSYEGFPGRGEVSFELFPVAGTTLLRVTSEGMHTFPQDIPEFSRESCTGGWQYFIQQRLKSYLG